jgi:hypothetical protein
MTKQLNLPMHNTNADANDDILCPNCAVVMCNPGLCKIGHGCWDIGTPLMENSNGVAG